MLVISTLDVLFKAYWWILIARFILSWIPEVDYGHPVVRFIYKITEPLVALFRGIVPPYRNVDFSPIILFLVLQLVYPLVRKILIDIFFRFGLF